MKYNYNYMCCIYTILDSINNDNYQPDIWLFIILLSN